MKYEITFHNKSNEIDLLKINSQSYKKFNRTYFRTLHIQMEVVL
jgi:hypothetical protein